jgi:hypothetical protein
MTRRALLVGSQVGLLATVNDLAAMRAALERHGFECRIASGRAATRSAICAAYRELIAETQPDDAAVFYFTGHGGHFPNPNYSPGGPRGVPRHYRFIVPTDFDETTDSDFRGITNHELAFLLDSLLARTKNVTVILDCCHAAMMSRAMPDARVKALDMPWQVGIESHLQSLRSMGIDIASEGRRMTAAVGVSACGSNARAFERVIDGRPLSLLTRFLAEALEQAALVPTVDWQCLLSTVRERVETCHPLQRPSVEGAARRLLFELRETDSDGLLGLVRRDGRFQLSGGHLHGVGFRDQYEIVALDPERRGQQQRLGTAMVTAVQITSATVELALGAGTIVPEQAMARPLSKGAPTLPVILDPSFSAFEHLAAAVRAADHLVVGDNHVEANPIRLAIGAGRVLAADARGVPCFAARTATERGMLEALDNLRAIARARSLVALVPGNAELLSSNALSWGIVDAGVETSLPHHGATVELDQRVFVRVTNDSADPCWVSLIDVGVAADRTLLNAYFAPDGLELAPGDSYLLGEVAGVLRGEALTWPAGLDRKYPRLETLLLFVTMQPMDLRPLEAAGVRGQDSKRSWLQAQLDRIERGVVDDTASRPDIEYQVMSVSFTLDPAPPS